MLTLHELSFYVSKQLSLISAGKQKSQIFFQALLSRQVGASGKLFRHFAVP